MLIFYLWASFERASFFYSDVTILLVKSTISIFASLFFSFFGQHPELIWIFLCLNAGMGAPVAGHLTKIICIFSIFQQKNQSQLEVHCPNFHQNQKLWELLRRILEVPWPYYVQLKRFHYPRTGIAWQNKRFVSC